MFKRQLLRRIHYEEEQAMMRNQKEKGEQHGW